MIDITRIEKMAHGDYTRGTYKIDDDKKIVSYKFGHGAVSVAVIEEFVKLANHTGYTFQTSFNDRELSASPGMTEKQVKDSFFGENKESTNQKLDVYSIDEMAHGDYTRGTYKIDNDKKIVSYELGHGAVSIAVIEKFTELANHTGYVFQTNFNGYDIIASPGMTEEQVKKAFKKDINNKNQLKALSLEQKLQESKTLISSQTNHHKDQIILNNDKNLANNPKDNKISTNTFIQFLKSLKRVKD